MATATKKVHVGTSPARAVRAVSEASSLEFLVYQANGGDYHWEIVDSSGESLVHSGSFTSQDDAERAVLYVYEGARSARFKPHVTKERQTVAV